LVPLAPEVLEYLRKDDVEFLRHYGVDRPPPPRRLWLVRSPWQTLNVDRLWRAISNRVRELQLADPAPVLLDAARQVLASDEQTVRRRSEPAQ
jgi:hypothetical protein